MLIEQVVEFKLKAPGPPGHRRSHEVRGSRPNRNVIYDKTAVKKPTVSSVSVSFRSFCIQRFLLAFVNNIDDQGPRPPQFNFFQSI